MPSVVPARGLRNGRVLAGGGTAAFVVYDVIGRLRGYGDGIGAWTAGEGRLPSMRSEPSRERFWEERSTIWPLSSIMLEKAYT